MLTVAAVTVFRPWHYDEGWILWIVSHFLKSGEYRTLFHVDSAQSFGKPWIFLLSRLALLDAYPTYYLYRIPSAVLCAVTMWMALSITNYVAPRCRTASLASVVYVCLWSSSYLVSLRVDAIYATVSVLIVYTWTRVHGKTTLSRADVILLGVSITSAFAAVSINPVAALLLPLAASVIWASQASIAPVQACGIAIWSSLSAILGLKLTLWDFSLRAFVTELVHFTQQDPLHTRTVYDEALRYTYFGSWTPFLCVATIVAAAGFVPTFLRRETFYKVILGQVLSLLLVFSIYPSKWPYYLALLLPHFVVSLAVLLDTLKDRQRVLMYVVGISLVVLCGTNLAVAVRCSLGEDTLSIFNYTFRYHQFDETFREVLRDPVTGRGPRVFGTPAFFPMFNLQSPFESNEDARFGEILPAEDGGPLGNVASSRCFPFAACLAFEPRRPFVVCFS